MKSKADCIVIHTNVLISAGLLPQSKSAQVLALAVDSSAKLIISGDCDLTQISTYGAIEIISPAMYFE